MSGSTYTRVETPTTDTSLNHFGYDFYVADITMNIPHFLGFLSTTSCWCTNLLGEEEGLLVTFDCQQAPERVYTKAFTWGRWSNLSGKVSNCL